MKFVTDRVSSTVKDWKPYLPPPSADEGEAEEISRAMGILARVIRILDIPDASFASYSMAINKLSEKQFTLSRSVIRLKRIEEELKEHLTALQHECSLIKHWNKVLTPGYRSSETASAVVEDVSILERRRDLMIRKAKGYYQEVEKMMKDRPIKVPVTLAQLLSQKEKNLARERDIIEKRAKLKAFQGLPPNLELARHELRSARQKQMELVKLRERLLRKMAEGVE